MAVQAQYPSNVLLLNRNGQEMKNGLGNEYSLQTQTGGLLDQSQMFFNSGGVVGINPRKRGRESGMGVNVNGNGNGNGGSGSGSVSVSATPINLFSLQPQPPPTTLINLSQLHNQQQQQPNLVSTGLRLAFGDQHPQHPQHPQHHQQQQQQQQQQQNIVLPCSSLSSIISDDLSTQIKQQRDEIDHFLQLQGDQLRRTLAERRQAHYRALLGVAEETASRRLREKEGEIEKASRRNCELEERVAQLRLEAQVWQNKARTQEATAAALQVQLQQAMMNVQDKREEGVGCSGGEGGGGGGGREADDAESAHIDPERVKSCGGPSCKACREGIASVVLLPCRHLSLCTNCNATVDTCPLCLSYRSASVEVYLS